MTTETPLMRFWRLVGPELTMGEVRRLATEHLKGPLASAVYEAQGAAAKSIGSFDVNPYLATSTAHELWLKGYSTAHALGL